jgi:anti-sigma factor RsiW
MTDTDQAVYPAASETDSRGFPVTGDTITITESSAGAVVALTQNTDGSATFVAVAPGTSTVSWTDGTLSFTDTITVDPGAPASLVVGAPVIEPIPAPPAP